LVNVWFAPVLKIFSILKECLRLVHDFKLWFQNVNLRFIRPHAIRKFRNSPCSLGMDISTPVLTIESSQQYNNILFTDPLTYRWVCNTVIMTVVTPLLYKWCLVSDEWDYGSSNCRVFDCRLAFDALVHYSFGSFVRSSASSLARFLLFIYASTRLNACNVLQVSMSNISLFSD